MNSLTLILHDVKISSHLIEFQNIMSLLVHFQLYADPLRLAIQLFFRRMRYYFDHYLRFYCIFSIIFMENPF